ncbi:hypothetical protein [Nisaea sp.]|uniref:hypothetical protein n=1 Tax=Nisaea sp. TaxID=2024842 RepID=UPI003B528E2C
MVSKCNQGGGGSTFLSRLHPYPAMVADELALSLADEYVHPGARVLDPFCGSGRFLSASKSASLRVGLDVNPLACLVANAKLSQARPEVIANGLSQLDHARKNCTSTKIKTFERKVDWFSEEAIDELGQIITWINSLNLNKPELFLFAATLSAATRDSSYARKSGWKLHRLDSESREQLKVSAWEKFTNRLQYCYKQLLKDEKRTGKTIIKNKDIRRFSHLKRNKKNQALFDVALTSPPYGDSRTTVQYGAASSLCLSIVSHIAGLERLAKTGGAIDAECLGGRIIPDTGISSLGRYWNGEAQSREGRMVVQFLSDYAAACKAIATNIAPGGKVVLVVGRRTTGGAPLLLDSFSIDRFTEQGFHLEKQTERFLKSKRIPNTINRFARSNKKSSDRDAIVKTMDREIIITLNKSTRTEKITK